MANTSTRTLRLLSLMQTHRYWPGVELADRLGVSVRTLRRDVDRLRELGYPVQAQRGVDGGYQLAPGAVLPPLVLDDQEAVALAVGLLAVAQSPVAGTAEASVQALAKVVSVMPKRLRRRVEALRSMTEIPGGYAASVDSEALAVVAQACRDTERIEFGYTSGNGVRSDRRVEPHRLVSSGRRWYLVGYDLDRHDWRSFRMDRMSAPRATGAWFAPRRLPASDAAAFVRTRFGAMPRSYVVTAVVDAPVARVRERIGRWASVTDRDGTRAEVAISTDSLDWAALALGTLEAEFRVESPPEFGAFLREWGARFTRAAERNPGPIAYFPR